MHIVISCDKIFLLVSEYLSLWSWPSLEFAIIGGIVFHKHILLIMKWFWFSMHFSFDELSQFKIEIGVERVIFIGVLLVRFELRVDWLINILISTALRLRMSFALIIICLGWCFFCSNGKIYLINMYAFVISLLYWFFSFFFGSGEGIAEKREIIVKW